MKIQCKTKLIIVGILSSFGVGITMPSLAQSSSPPTAAGPAPTAQAQARDVRASQLIGKEVRDAKGEKLGKIEDLIVDADNEQVRYAVISVGGVLGLGDKLFVFPISTLRASGDQLVLNVDKERLKKAPAFDRDRPLDLSKTGWHRAVDRFYFKEDTMRQSQPGARMMSAKQLIGANVNDRAAHDAGDIEDVVVNLSNGRAYLVLDFDKAWSPDDKLLPLPFSAFTFPSRPDLDILLNVDRDKLDMTRGFDDDKWPDLNSPNYQKAINDHLQSFRMQSKESPQSTQTGRETVTRRKSE